MINRQSNVNELNQMYLKDKIFSYKFICKVGQI